MKKSEKKQQAIEKENQNVIAQNTMQDAQNEIQKKSSVNLSSDIDKFAKKDNKKFCVGILDDATRGIFSNMKYLKKLCEISDDFKHWMAYNAIKHEDLTIDFLFENLPEKRIFVDEKGDKYIVCTKKYLPEYDNILVDTFVINENKYCRLKMLKYTANQFISLFEIAKKNQIKKQFEVIREKTQNQKTQIKENKQVQKNIQNLKNVLPNLI